VTFAAIPQIERLPSGMRLAIVPLPHAHQTVVWAELEVGSRYEQPAENGLSHFLEHMLFRGTPSLPTADAVALAIDDAGATLEASTSADTGTLSTCMPPESFDTVVPIFADVFAHPVYDALETERSIVREEILEDLDERGRMIDPDTLLAALAFGEHSLGQSIVGSLQQLERFDRDALAAHHARHYVAALTVLTIAGPVDPTRARDVILERFGQLPPGQPLGLTRPSPQSAPRFRHVRHADSQTALRIGFRAPGSEHQDEPAVQLLMRVLDDGMSTRLYRRVCDQLGLCYDVSADYAAYRDVGLVTIAADAAHERASRVLDECLTIVQRLRDDGPTEAELDRAKRRHAWGLRELLDDPESLAEVVAESLVARRAPSLDDRLEEIRAVDLETVRRVAGEIFRPESLSVVAVGEDRRSRTAELRTRAEGFE
jgi:predicted Zn-dependent peptidase